MRPLMRRLDCHLGRQYIIRWNRLVDICFVWRDPQRFASFAALALRPRYMKDSQSWDNPVQLSLKWTLQTEVLNISDVICCIAWCSICELRVHLLPESFEEEVRSRMGKSILEHLRRLPETLCTSSSCCTLDRASAAGPLHVPSGCRSGLLNSRPLASLTVCPLSVTDSKGTGHN